AQIAWTPLRIRQRQMAAVGWREWLRRREVLARRGSPFPHTGAAHGLTSTRSGGRRWMDPCKLNGSQRYRFAVTGIALHLERLPAGSSKNREAGGAGKDVDTYAPFDPNR